MMSRLRTCCICGGRPLLTENTFVVRSVFSVAFGGTFEFVERALLFFEIPLAILFSVLSSFVYGIRPNNVLVCLGIHW